MIFSELKIPGVFLIELERIEDERGYFARTFCQTEFAKQGLHTSFSQYSLSFNKKKGTLRGMHYQETPHAEVKIVQCIKGGIYDVLVDLRSDSKTFAQWIAVELNESNHRMLYIPEGIAHGFQTLTDNAEIFYRISVPYAKEFAKGVRWNDPAFQIQWPLPISVISKKDEEHPLYQALQKIAP